jgi:DMSO/TMAO reductase YedYZ molybdopterin-dependent catalytic subunit
VACRIRGRPRQTLAITLECAGNGRARLSPRPVSQPWLNEGIGTAEWTGTPLAGVLADAGLKRGTVELVFTRADHGVEKGYEHDYARSLTVDDATPPETLSPPSSPGTIRAWATTSFRPSTFRYDSFWPMSSHHWSDK